MTNTVMFNPYTGKPRHPSDIASDPAGILIVEPDAPVKAAAKPAQINGGTLQMIAHALAFWVSDCWTRAHPRPLYSKARAICIYDRSLNEVVRGR